MMTAFEEMNVVFCELMSTFMLDRMRRGHDDLPVWSAPLSAYVQQLLTIQPGTKTLRYEHLEQLLPSIWRYLIISNIGIHVVVYCMLCRKKMQLNCS
jgi:hypothetical protein